MIFCLHAGHGEEDMDPENVGKETILKVTDWLRGIWEMRRRGGPVQQWIDSIPVSAKPEQDVTVVNECREYVVGEKPPTPTEPKDIPFPTDTKPPSMTISAPINVSDSPAMSTPILPSSLPHSRLARDASFQSDSSHCSSVESLLELRKADPTAILLDLGFGGCSASPQENGSLCRIPKRFLQPSSLRGIAIDDFVRQQQETSESIDSVSLGYRGLTGSPYIAPSEIVQKIMERLREHENHETDASLYVCCEQQSPSQQSGRLSVLSPDNRQFLEQSRSKSPDMRNKRMIIGQKSFTFGRDGHLIEVAAGDAKLASGDTVDSSPNAATTLGTGESAAESERSPVENITFEYYCFSNSGNKLAKQLSFDDTVEFPENDRAITPSDSSVAQGGVDNVDNIDNNERRYNSSVTTSEKREHCLDFRRASDGSCNSKSLGDKAFDEGRRFSDSAVRIVASQRDEYTLSQKRKSLKRQSRVCDATASMHYREQSPVMSSLSDAILESNVADNVADNVAAVQSDVISSTDTHQLNAPKSFRWTASKGDSELKIDAESRAEKSNRACSKTSESSSDRIERFEVSEEDNAPSDHSCTRDNQLCCYKGKCKSWKYGSSCSDCCCRINKKKYLKKMKKVMKENKKLENMLAKSRREVAQIRGMLSNIMSVRMEPGF